mmetsp:Transcript_55063/g.103204  ORF Transcript_55063/g.103204 Transcript_55063/m.103204 type:complete len:422 (-) Transcript_55063:47-1312(-)
MQKFLSFGRFAATLAAVLAGDADAAKAATLSSRSSALRSGVGSLSDDKIPASLENIETALLALERQRGTPGLTGTVAEIHKMVGNMEMMVQQQAKLTQQTLDQAWSDFVSCSGLYDAGAHADLQSVQSLAKEHAACRLEESSSKIGLEACESELDARSSSETQRKSEFDALNKFPASGFCAHHSNSPDYTTVRGYIKHFRDHFASHLTSWENAFNASTQATKMKVAKQRDCYGDDQAKDGKGGKDAAYTAQKLSCQKLQQKLEDAACDRIAHRTDCVSYAKCYQDNFNAFFATGQAKETALLQTQKQATEYRGLGRIKCVLNAYSRYSDGPELSKSIEDCQQIRSNQTFFQLNLPDEKPGSMPTDQTSCLNKDSAEKPGSQAFTQEFYKKLIDADDSTHWDNVKSDVLTCKGRCCAVEATV